MVMIMTILPGGYADADRFVYRFSDEYGNQRVSGSLKSIPKRYRAGAKKMKVIDTSGAVKTEKPFRKAYGSANVKFTIIEDRIIVPALFNGKIGRSAVIDTGSEWIVISSKLAGALGYNINGVKRRWVRSSGGAIRAPVIRLANVRVGDAVVSGLKAVIMDFEGRESASAIIGMNFLSAFTIKIDMSGKIMTLAMER